MVLRCGAEVWCLQMLKWMDNNLDKLLVDLSARAPVEPAKAPAAKPVETTTGKPLEVLAIQCQCRQTLLIVQQVSPVKSSSITEAPAKALNSTDGWCTDLNRVTSCAAAGEEAAAAEDSQEVSICAPLGWRNNILTSCAVSRVSGMCEVRTAKACWRVEPRETH